MTTDAVAFLKAFNRIISAKEKPAIMIGHKHQKLNCPPIMHVYNYYGMECLNCVCVCVSVDTREFHIKKKTFDIFWVSISWYNYYQVTEMMKRKNQKKYLEQTSDSLRAHHYYKHEKWAVYHHRLKLLLLNKFFSSLSWVNFFFVPVEGAWLKSLYLIASFLSWAKCLVRSKRQIAFTKKNVNERILPFIPCHFFPWMCYEIGWLSKFFVDKLLF